MEIIELFSSHGESGSLRGTPVMGLAGSFIATHGETIIRILRPEKY